MIQQNAAKILRESCNTDWRSNRPCLIERFKHLCLREELSDADFVFNKGLLDETKIPAHTLILTVSSEFFEKLFVYDGDKKMKRQAIVVKDQKLNADTVKILLKFIYSNFKDVADINWDNIWDVIYAAKMYMLISLEKHCADFLMKNLSENNVLEILDQCLKWTVNPQLLIKCKTLLQIHTEVVLKSEKFPNISLEHLIILLEQDTLSVSEGDLFKSVLDWAKCACKATEIEATPENLRKKLGAKAFSLIRFPTISKEDFVNVVFPSKIFTMQEQHDLLMTMTFDGAPIENPLQFSKQRRKKLTIVNAIRGLLNKITPTSYSELSETFVNYEIHKDQVMLEKIIDLIFGKAVEEPLFCPLYSDLCRKQAEMEYPEIQDVTFRKGLISKCQQAFNPSFSLEIAELEKRMVDETDGEAKLFLNEELDTLKSKEKRRFFGIIRFIAELYLRQLLNEKIITWCVFELLKKYVPGNGDDVYVEYAIRMIETVGVTYEINLNFNLTKQKELQPLILPSDAINYLTSLKSTVSNRVRFMILNLEELRQNNWEVKTNIRERCL